MFSLGAMRRVGGDLKEKCVLAHQKPLRDV